MVDSEGRGSYKRKESLMVKFPTKSELDAMSEWNKRHPFDAWPLNDIASPGANENKKKEARELIQAAQEGTPYDLVPEYNYTPGQFEHYPGTQSENPLGAANLQIKQLEEENTRLRDELSKIKSKSIQDWEEEQRKIDLNNKIEANQLRIERFNKSQS